MKTKIRKLISMCGTLFASLAMLVALNSVTNTRGTMEIIALSVKKIGA